MTSSSPLLDVVNPATGERLASLERMQADQVRQAIAAGQQGLSVRRTTRQRGIMLAEIAEGLLAQRGELARIICTENGKPWREAEGEVDYAAGFFRFYSEQVHRLRSRRLRREPRGHQWIIHYRPSGVAALIVPWNFPLAMLAKKLAAAIAAGAPAIIKPADQTPLASLALKDLLATTSVPPSWFHWVIGDAAMIGKVICEHPAIRSISFTGSTAVGKILLQQTADQMKRLTLELGGNAPLIIDQGVNLDSVVEHLIQNKFRCAGQTCVCVNRIYVHANQQSALIEKLVARASTLRMGNGLLPDTDLGPLINRSGFNKVAAQVEDALQRGAKLHLGGTPSIAAAQSYGFFFSPTVLGDVSQDSLCAREETFGPLLPVIPYQHRRQALEWANATEFGLAAYLFTNSAAFARRAIRVLHFGHVGLNSATGPTPEAPFGGMKQSGFGREGGREGLMEFVETQVVARDRHSEMS